MTVRLSGKLISASTAEAEIVRVHLAEHVRLTRQEPGCLSFEVAPTESPGVWSVEEQFVDRHAFEAHQARTRASAWGAATQGVRREYKVFAEP
jgi:quinol monooxygenase YgiN